VGDCKPNVQLRHDAGTVDLPAPFLGDPGDGDKETCAAPTWARPNLYNMALFGKVNKEQRAVLQRRLKSPHCRTAIVNRGLITESS